MRGGLDASVLQLLLSLREEWVKGIAMGFVFGFILELLLHIFLWKWLYSRN